MSSLWELAGRLVGLLLPQKRSKELKPPAWIASALRNAGSPSISEHAPANPELATATQQNKQLLSAPLLEPATRPSSKRDAEAQVENELYFHAIAASVVESRFEIPRPSPAQQGMMRWVPAGESLRIHDHVISRGMVYTGMKSEVTEPSLLDPTLRVERGVAEPLTYWPSYAAMVSGARFRYLAWLADGAADPIDIGYVFVYFYGLERRLLVDGAAGSLEASGLLTEIERLLSLYGENGSFRFYASSLLAFVRNSNLEDIDIFAPIPCSSSNTYEVPFSLRLALGYLARSERKLPAIWAHQWSLCDPLISTRTPAQRCPHEFASAFEFVYQTRHADGFLLPRNKTTLKSSYRPASAGLAGAKIELSWGDLPDVLAVIGPRKKLQAVVDDATEMIEPYSRFLGRNEAKKDTLESWLTLPPFLWPNQLREQVNLLRSTTVASLEGLPLKALFQHFGYTETPTPALVASLTQALENVGIGFEPDILAGARRPNTEDHVVLFPLVESLPPDRAADSYKAASLDVALSACFALADGNACEREQQLVDNRVASLGHLSPDLQTRLRAQYRLQVRKPTSFAALKAKVGALSEERRYELALNLSAMANVDGMVSPEEVRFMEQLYRSLQLDTKLVYAHLYSGETKPSAGSNTGIIPAQVQRPTINLDKARIERLQQETAQVSALLSSVFLEEESQPLPPALPGLIPAEDVPTESGSPLLPGLEGEASEFLLLLLSRARWTRIELEDAASDMQIMLDGTLEQINEAALDAFDEMLLEGEDPVFVQQSLLEKPAA